MKKLTTSLLALLPIVGVIAVGLVSSASLEAHAKKPKRYKAKVPLGSPLPGLTGPERALFNEGKRLFEKDFTAAEGLGPLYNARSCLLCHGHPVTGGSQASTDDNVIHFGVKDEDRFLAMFEVGGPVQQRISLAGDPETPMCEMPADDAFTTVAALGPDAGTSERHTPPIFGFGLIDAIPDHQIIANQARNRDKGWGVQGFTNWGVELETVGPYTNFTPDLTRTQPYGASRVGRFGWKAQTATIWQFSNDPLNIELGITSPWFKRENTPDGGAIPPECDVAEHAVNDVDNHISLSLFYFQALIAPPSRGKVGKKERRGEYIFASIGCAECHTPEYTTVEDYYMPLPDGSTHRVNALSNVTFEPFSDFLVHDMGDALADKRQMGRADGRHWRTTPLWGVRHKTNLMHDGSETTLHGAIMAHGGEGSASRDAYANLPKRKKKLLRKFLKSL